MKLPTFRLGSGAPADGMALADITGNLTRTADGAVTAWFELRPKRWAFLSDMAREEWIRTVAGQYAALLGVGAFRLHLRRTTIPWPTDGWRHCVLADSRVPDRAAENVLLGHVGAAAAHLDAAMPVEPTTLLGVEVPAAAAAALAGGRLGAAFAGLFGRGAAASSTVAERVQRIADILTPPALGAKPASETLLAWLVLRSLGMGLTLPDRRGMSIGADGLLEASGRYRRIRGRYGARVTYVDTISGEEAHVAALTLGDLPELEVPQRNEPWLWLAECAGFPVEVSSRVQVVRPAVAAKALGLRHNMIRHQIADYLEKDLPVPADLARHAEHAAQAADEASTGRPDAATRLHGFHRMAVWGATAAECDERVRELIALYERESRTTLLRPSDQAPILREFIPGEPTADTGYLRKLNALTWAAGVPQVSRAVGDNTGDLIGWVDDTKRPVLWNPHRAMQVREMSGLTAFVAEPGGGKSTLLGATGAQAAIRGVQVTILDPSGPLARLADLPQLRGRVRVLELDGAEPGTLAPYALVPEPRAADHATAGAYERSVVLARSERKALATDVCMMLLRPQLVRRDDVAVALDVAIRQVPRTADSTLDDVVKALREAGDTVSQLVAGQLEDAAETPQGALLFGRPPADAVGADAQMLVITLGGLQLPDMDVEREYWPLAERIAVPLLHCAHLLAARRCYGGDMRTRKLVALDEVQFLNAWPSGRALLLRLARDSRKWNLATLVAAQDPREVLALNVLNKVSTVFLGRLAADDKEIAAEALRLLRVPDTTEGRYGRLLAGLSQQVEGSDERLGFREFVMRDPDGRIQRIRIDLGWMPNLLSVLDTTPDGGPR